MNNSVKRFYSLLMRISVIVLALVLVAAPLSVLAETEEAPVMLSKEYTGKTLCKVTAYFSEQKNLSFSATKASGTKSALTKNTELSVIGSSQKNADILYVKKTINSKTCYGYIDRKNICIVTTKTSKVKSVKRYNPFYNKKIKYRYIKKSKMRFYEFNQGMYPSKVINGLKVGYSCGPHAIAAALSALNGDIIFPEEIIKKMSRDAIAPDFKGTGTNKVISSVKPYIKKKHKLNFEYENIPQSKIFEYLKNGYMVITAVENHDGLELFTKNAHFILLIGYDSAGNVVTLSSNKRVGFCDSFSESRISANFPDNENDEDIIAIKWKYDDSYEKLEKPKKRRLTNNAKVYQHYLNYGKIRKLNKNKKVTILGKRNKMYYIKYKYQKKTRYGFINQKHIGNID